MRLRDVTNMLIKRKRLPVVILKFTVLFTVAVLTTGYSQTASAEVWADVRDNVITSNGVFDCTECHSYLKTIAGDSSSILSRHSAPDNTDFDGATDLTAYNNITTLSAYFGSTADVTYGFADGFKDRVYEWAADLVNTGAMPMDPTVDVAPGPPDGIIDDFVDASDLDATRMATILTWALQGAPYAAASATTSAASGITKTGATLNATIDTNVHSGTAVPGTYFYEYEEEVAGAIGAYDSSTSAVPRSSTSSTTSTGIAISGLSCGTQYNFRAVATNGSGSTNGSNITFNTSSCTAPEIAEGASISPALFDEDTDITFTLNRTDNDPGTLTWSVLTQGSKGTFSFDTSDTDSPVTVRYSPVSNQNGADTAGRIRITNSTTGLTDTIIVNIDITAINDQGAITSTPSTSAIEDVQYSYQVVNNDPDDSFGSGLTISLSNEPAGMVVGGSTGLVTWTPANGVVNSGLVTVTVSDGLENGAVSVMQQYTITVTATNDPPTITSTASTSAIEDIQYSYQVLLNDVDDNNNGTDIDFTLSNAPDGMTVSSTGLIAWIATEGVSTSGAVTITIEDGNEDNSMPAVGNGGVEIFTVGVTAVNDSASITSTAITTGDEEVPYSYSVTASDVDDMGGFGFPPNANQLQITLSGEPAGMAVDTSTGIITWTPPRTGAQLAYNNISVTVQDGLEDGAVVSQQVFSVMINIDDTDGDLIAVYADNCPADANVAQADNDNDTVYVANAGFPVIGDVDQSDPLTGGDVCDTDDDNDGMPDAFEDMFAFLDPFDSADANADEDGDGLTNLEEYNLDNSGATIATDNVGPDVIAPDDIIIDATGLLTVVDIGTATGIDGNEGEVSLFKVALNETVADCNALSSLETDIVSFRPGSHTVTWVSCDSGGNLGSDDQIVNVKPLVSMAAGQFIGEGQAVSIEVVLNGDAIAYPATVDYTFSGTTVAGIDHDGVAGTVTFLDKGEVGTISFNTISDTVVEDDETVTVTLSAPFNITLSNAVTHTVTITEANVAPQVSLSVTQPAAVLDTNKGNTLYTADGLATIIANATDGNGDALSYDWSATDANLFAAATITNGQFDFDPSALTVGTFYKVSVTVSDGQLPVTVDRLLLIKTIESNAWVLGQDDDDDGVDNLAEGYGDEDGDGIPNYLDNISTPANAIENYTANLETSVLIETDPGLQIALGETAIASSATGVLIGLQDIVDHGGSGGAAVTNAATDHTFLSGLLNFEVSGLTESIVSVNVVVPLQAAIQVDTIVRKYNSMGWFDFVVDDLNEIRSAPGIGGTCPQPASILYTVGLTPGHLCLQLTIQDGGANDADGVRNYIVKDPSGLALAPESEVEVDAESSGNSSGRLGSTSQWFMLVFLMCTAYLWRERRLRRTIKNH